MIRLDFLHGYTAFRSLVLNVFVQSSERPYVVPLRVWKPLSNIGQLLEHDHVTIVFDGLRNDLVSHSVNVLFPPCFLSLPEAKQGVMRSLCAALLHLTPSLLELAAPVVVVVSLPEAPRGGNGEIGNAEVDTEDCLVLGIFRTLRRLTVCFRVVLPGGDIEVELVVHCVVLKRARSELKLFGQHVPFVRRGAIRGKFKLTLNTPVDRRERDFIPVERRAPLVVEHAPRCELRLAHSLSVFPSLNTACDGLDATSNGFLNEVSVRSVSSRSSS